MLIIKRILSAALAAALLLACCPAARAEGQPSVSADCAVVMHSGGEVIYEKNADRRSLIASTTKLMTAILAIELLPLEQTVEIDPAWCAVEGSSMYLKPGESYSVRELLTGLLLASGNDAALALANCAAEGEEAFARLMNQKAEELGMESSHFVNPHGLNAEEHYSTARDLALLMDYCMRNETFAALAGTESATVKEQTYVNHNRLLRECPGCIAGKTGYTQLAGRCLVTCCEREGMRLICVTLSDPDDWNDHQRLYDWAYANYAERLIGGDLRFEVPVVSGSAENAQAVPEELKLFLPNTALPVLRAELPFFVFAPVKAGDPAGTLSVLLDGEKVAETELVYEKDVPLKLPTGSFTERWMEPLS